MPERFRRGLNGLLVLLILGALAYASALLFGWNCPIKYLTGVPCAAGRFVRAVWQKAAFRLQKPRARAAVERYRAGYRNLADTSRAA